MLVARIHYGTKNLNFMMSDYVFRRNKEGVHIINLTKTWEKLVLAARIIAAIENPQDVIVIGARDNSQRAVLKFCKYTGCQTISGRYTPGTFTNQITKQFREPRLLACVDLFFARDPKEIEESQKAAEAAPAAPEGEAAPTEEGWEQPVVESQW